MGGEVGHRHLIQADSKAGRRECGASAEVGVSEELSPDAATTGTPNAASRPMRRSRSLDAVLGMKLPIANFGFDFRKAVPRQTARLKTRRLLHPCLHKSG